MTTPELVSGLRNARLDPMVIASIVAGVALILFFSGLKSIAIPLLMVTCMLAYFNLSGSDRSQNRRTACLLTGAALGLAYQTYSVAKVVLDPGTWDYLCFYLDGQVTASTGDPYDPLNYHTVFSTINFPGSIDPQFGQEILDVGFKYLPISMLMVLPLGYVDFGTGLLVWLGVFIGLFGFLVVALIQRSLPSEKSRLSSICFTVAIVTLFPASIEVTNYQQILFACLAVLLVIDRVPNQLMAGIAAAVGLVFKPIMVVGAAYLVFTRQYRAIGVSVIGLAALIALTIQLVGLDPVLSYFQIDFVTRVPLFQYSEAVNQSLLATLIRTFESAPAVHPLERLDFRVISVLIVAITIVSAFRARQTGQHGLVLSICTSGVLLIYPGTMTSYAVLLLLPLFVLLKQIQIANLSNVADSFATGWTNSLSVTGALFVGLIAVLLFWQPFVAFVCIWLLFGLMAFNPPSSLSEEH